MILILTCGMLLDFQKEKTHSSIGSCFFFAFKHHASKINERCIEIYRYFFYYWALVVKRKQVNFKSALAFQTSSRVAKPVRVLAWFVHP